MKLGLAILLLAAFAFFAGRADAATQVERMHLVQPDGRVLPTSCEVRGDGLPHWQGRGPDPSLRIVSHDALTPVELAHLMSLPFEDPASVPVQEVLVTTSSDWACVAIRCNSYESTNYCPRKDQPLRRCVEGERTRKRDYGVTLSSDPTVTQSRPAGCVQKVYVPEPPWLLGVLCGVGMLLALGKRNLVASRHRPKW